MCGGGGGGGGGGSDTSFGPNSKGTLGAAGLSTGAQMTGFSTGSAPLNAPKTPVKGNIDRDGDGKVDVTDSGGRSVKSGTPGVTVNSGMSINGFNPDAGRVQHLTTNVEQPVGFKQQGQQLGSQITSGLAGANFRSDLSTSDVSNLSKDISSPDAGIGILGAIARIGAAVLAPPTIPGIIAGTAVGLAADAADKSFGHSNVASLPGSGGLFGRTDEGSPHGSRATGPGGTGSPGDSGADSLSGGAAPAAKSSVAPAKLAGTGTPSATGQAATKKKPRTGGTAVASRATSRLGSRTLSAGLGAAPVRRPGASAILG